MGVLGWLGATASPTLAIVVATASLGTGLLAQSLGSLCLLALVRPDAAATALIAWAMVQPVLYAQLSNLEFLSESISVLGGLLMLRVHLISAKRRRLASAPSGKALDSVADSSLALARLLGRLLLPAAYVHRAGIYLLRAFALDETADVAAFLSSLSAFAINVALLAGLVVASFLVAAGLKSRTVALALAAANLCYTAYSHPFLALLRREGGAWAVDEDAVWSDAAAAGGGVARRPHALADIRPAPVLLLPGAVHVGRVAAAGAAGAGHHRRSEERIAAARRGQGKGLTRHFYLIIC